jgi:glycerol kinase
MFVIGVGSMEKKYIIALDQGTTSTRAIVFNRYSKIIAMESRDLEQIYPRPGWVEHDPQKIWEDQLLVLKNTFRNHHISPEEIEGIGITNQRETVVIWDKRTGKPIHNAIVWQCRRTASICDALKKNGLENRIHQKTGLVVDAYFSGSKISWILDHVKGAREKARKGEILVGTIDTWLLWNLTGGKRHVTDYSNASRTMLFNIHTLKWDEDLLKELDIPSSILPEVVPSSGMIATLEEKILGVQIPISGIAGDQQAALFGQGCFEKGQAKNTYGTGCFLLVNTGKTPKFSTHKLLTTIAWDIGDGVVYALEGSVFNAGASIQWLRDGLGILEDAAQSEGMAQKVEDTGGVYVVPAFTGLGTPYWDMYARGTIVGITRGTRKEHIIRATLESIAYQTRDVLEAMKQDTGLDILELKVDGGASKNHFLMQFQADISGIPVNRPKISETTALGAAYLAGLGVGFWKSQEDIQKNWASAEVFTPKMDGGMRIKKYTWWKKAVERAKHWEG